MRRPCCVCTRSCSPPPRTAATQQTNTHTSATRPHTRIALPQLSPPTRSPLRPTSTCSPYTYHQTRYFYLIILFKRDMWSPLASSPLAVAMQQGHVSRAPRSVTPPQGRTGPPLLQAAGQRCSVCRAGQRRGAAVVAYAASSGASLQQLDKYLVRTNAHVRHVATRMRSGR